MEESKEETINTANSDSDWEDVIHSSDEDKGLEKKQESNKIVSGEDTDIPKESVFLTAVEKEEKAKLVTASRILSDAEFKKIEATQLKKQVQAFRKGKKGKKRTKEVAEDGDIVPEKYREELVSLANIEMVHKKRRHDKEARMATVLEGREGREKFGSRKGKLNPMSSTTNKQKLKNKNFMMVKNKFKAKAKKSFVQKQRELKKAMIRSQKFK